MSCQLFIYIFVTELDSVTRLGDFWKFWVKNSVTKVAQTYSDFFAILTASRFSQTLHWQHLEKLGYFFSSASGHTGTEQHHHHLSFQAGVASERCDDPQCCRGHLTPDPLRGAGLDGGPLSCSRHMAFSWSSTWSSADTTRGHHLILHVATCWFYTWPPSNSTRGHQLIKHVP